MRSLVPVAALLLATPLSAQTVVFGNSSNPSNGGQPYSIPLVPGSGSQLKPNGELRVSCVLESGGRCAGFPTGGGAAPTVSLSTNATDVDAGTPGLQVNVGTSFAITPTLGNAPELCARSASPSVAGWSGPVEPQFAGGNVSLGQAGTYALKLRCFNGGGAGESTLSVTAISGGGGFNEPAACANIRAQHGFQRLGLTTVVDPLTNSSVNRDLTTLRGLYDGTIGTKLYFVKTQAGQYIGMAFTAAHLQADMNLSGYSPGGQQQTQQPIADYAYMTISKCAGDFRLRSDVGYNDPYLACASELDGGGWDNMVNFTIGSHGTYNGLTNVCSIDTTSTYHVNIVFADPRPSAPGQPGLAPGEFACDGFQCGFKYGTN